MRGAGLNWTERVLAVGTNANECPHTDKSTTKTAARNDENDWRRFIFGGIGIV
jgi:hypothetical protein